MDWQQRQVIERPCLFRSKSILWREVVCRVLALAAFSRREWDRWGQRGAVQEWTDSQFAQLILCSSQARHSHLHQHVDCRQEPLLLVRTLLTVRSDAPRWRDNGAQMSKLPQYCSAVVPREPGRWMHRFKCRCGIQVSTSVIPHLEAVDNGVFVTGGLEQLACWPKQERLYSCVRLAGWNVHSPVPFGFNAIYPMRTSQIGVRWYHLNCS